MTQKTFYTLIALALTLTGCHSKAPYEDDLVRLDYVIDHNEQWVGRKAARIDFLKEKILKTRAEEEIYWLNKDLFNEYKDYDADSALIYVNRNIALSRNLGKKEDEVLWWIEHVGTLVNTGRLEEAEKELNHIEPEGLSEYGKMKYFAQKMCLNLAYSYYVEEVGTPGPARSSYFIQALQDRDSTIKYVSPDIPEYLNIKAWQALDEQETDTLKVQLRAKIDASDLDNVEDAVGAYTLSQIYKEDGQKDEFLHYLILSAISYVKSGNRNYASESLQDLSTQLLYNGDAARAYRYINYCYANLSTYKNRVHIVRINKIQDRIASAYLKKERGQARRVNISLIFTSILGWALIALLFFTKRQMKKLKKSRQELSEVNALLKTALDEKEELNGRVSRRNQSLAQLNQTLDTANTKLQETNEVKEKYIGYVFSLCSEFIVKLEDFRKTAFRLLKVGMRDKLEDYLSSPTVMQDELKAFYQGFDETFLELYPDFVEKLNDLMQPGQELRQREPSRLTTDLRILALMRLGITDCNQIAEFLHCSVQSVYNSRRAVYARMSISPKEFKDRISGIGVIHAEKASEAEEA